MRAAHYTTKGYVYVVRFGPVVKVGFTSNMDSRIRSLMYIAGEGAEFLGCVVGTRKDEAKAIKFGERAHDRSQEVRIAEGFPSLSEIFPRKKLLLHIPKKVKRPKNDGYAIFSVRVSDELRSAMRARAVAEHRTVYEFTERALRRVLKLPQLSSKQRAEYLASNKQYSRYRPSPYQNNPIVEECEERKALEAAK